MAANLLYLSILFINFALTVSQNDVISSYSINPLSIQLTRLSSFFDLSPKRQCTNSRAKLCFEEIFEDDICLTFTKQSYSKPEWNPSAEMEYAKEFREKFVDCMTEKSQNLTTSDSAESIFIPALEDPFYGMQFEEFPNRTFQNDYEKCIRLRIQSCFNRENCYLISHEKVIHELFPKCRFEIMQKLKEDYCGESEVSGECSKANSSASELRISKPFNKFAVFDELSNSKIGEIPSLNTTDLSQETIQIFQNLTFAHIEAIKLYLLSIIELKRSFCDPSSSLDYFIQPGPHESKMFSNLPEEFPYFPAQTKAILSTLTYQQFIAAKNVTNVNDLYRWIICSPIVGISPPIKVTVHRFEKLDLKNVEFNQASDCRKIARKDWKMKNLMCN